MHICFAYFTLLPCSWLSGSSISGSFLPVSCNRNRQSQDQWGRSLERWPNTMAKVAFCIHNVINGRHTTLTPNFEINSYWWTQSVIGEHILWLVDTLCDWWTHPVTGGHSLWLVNTVCDWLTQSVFGGRNLWLVDTSCDWRMDGARGWVSFLPVHKTNTTLLSSGSQFNFQPLIQNIAEIYPDSRILKR
jgi:hypothetical protein